MAKRVIATVLISLVAAALGLTVPAQTTAFAASQGTSSISAGDEQSCAIESGKAYCWGYNGSGQLGDRTTTDSSVPVAVDTSGALAGKTLTQIATGDNYTCALDSAGAAYCWGYNLYYGDLGDGHTVNSNVPVAVNTGGVLAGKTLTQITAGSDTTCVLDTTGAAYCWGNNSAGQLGDGTTTRSLVPVAVDTSGVLAGKTLTRITANDGDVCALDTTGAAYCWGYNGNGGLGDGTTVSSNVPVAVDTGGVLAGKTLTQITAALYQTCAVDAAGAAYCWGFNGDGEFGDGTTVSSSVPVAVDTNGVLAGKSLTQITAGREHTCALDSAGAVYCWGSSFYGQLGDGSLATSEVPVAVSTSGVLAGKTLSQITDGYYHSCAVNTAGAVYCWGDNTYGELGDNDAHDLSEVPVLAGPQAPTAVTTAPGDSAVTASWTAPASLDGSTLTGYTATATPGGQTCTTAGATACTITGLANGTTYSVTVVTHTTAGDSGASAPATVTPEGGPAFTSGASDTAVAGTAFSFTVTTTGSPAPMITETGRLPKGVKFASHGDGTATISGTPARTAAGGYPLTLTATSSAGTTTQAFTLTIASRPAIKKIPATTAKAGAPMHLAITATGFPAPRITQTGPLPAGLSFIDSGNGTATITGTPAASSGGRYRLIITAANPAGTARRAFTLTITQPTARSGTDMATATTGSASIFPVTATGFPTPKITKATAAKGRDIPLCHRDLRWHSQTRN